MLTHSGLTRTRSSIVHFRGNARIGSDPRVLPAGRYAIHTREEVHQGSFDPVYVATSIDLMVESPGSCSTRVLRPADLHAAMERDARGLDDRGENLDRGRAGKVVAGRPLSIGSPR